MRARACAHARMLKLRYDMLQHDHVLSSAAQSCELSVESTFGIGVATA